MKQQNLPKESEFESKEDYEKYVENYYKKKSPQKKRRWNEPSYRLLKIIKK